MQSLARKALYIVQLLLICSVVTAQKKYPNTMLWRITGKNLQRPSYLFGTIHLNDNRIFRLGDSVYHSIESTEGLAIELNPEELAAYTMNMLSEEMDKSTPVQEVLDKNTWNKYSKKLAAKFNKPAGTITTHDIVQEKNRWMQDYFRKGDISTFLDAWLCLTAKKQGKWIGGIEDMADQSGLIDEAIDESDINAALTPGSIAEDTALSSLLQKYINQDLDAIAAIEYSNKDALLIKRNIKMARRIDSLTAFRSTFFAIGAAHLPGEEGVIHLLQQRGFHVEPVFSSRKMNASDYKYKEVEVPWTSFTDSGSLYTVSMPGHPVPLHIPYVTNTNFYMDLLSMTGFGVMNVQIPGGLINPDTLIYSAARAMTKQRDIIGIKRSNGGTEFIANLNGSKARVELFIHNNNLIMAMFVSLQDKMLSSPASDRFFRSIQLKEPATPEAAQYQFTDSLTGASCRYNARFEYNQALSTSKDPAWNVRTYAAIDPQGTYAMFMFKEMKSGYCLTSDSVAFASLFEDIRPKYNNLITTPATIDGLPAQRFSGILKEQQVYVQGIAVNKHSRQIIMMILSDSANKENSSSNSLLSSFHFTPALIQASWQNYSVNNGQFACYAPAPFTPYNGVADMYVSYDTTTATSYIVSLDTIGKYAWYTSDSVLYSDNLYKDADTGIILSKTPVAYNNLKGLEVISKKATTDLIHYRKQLIVNGNVIYKLTAITDSASLFNAAGNKYFQSLTIPVQPDSNYATRSKLPEILKDLKDTDTDKRTDAYTAISLIPLNSTTIPQIHQAMLQTWPTPYDSSGTGNITNYAFAQLLEHHHDTSAITFAKQTYPALATDKSPLAPVILHVLSGLKTRQSYSTFIQLALQYPPIAGDYNREYELQFKDTLSLTAQVFDSLLLLSSNQQLSPMIASLAVTMLDSNLISIGKLTPWKATFIKTATLELIESNTEEYAEDNSKACNLVKLLGMFKDPAADKVLSDYATIKNKSVRTAIVTTLLKNGRQVPPAAILSLAKDSTTRLYLYNNLEEIHKKSLFPKQYLTRKHFAVAQIADAALENELADVTIRYISQKEGALADGKYQFLLFKVTTADGTSYLGVTGGYKLNSTSIMPEEEADISDIYLDEELKAENINKLFSNWLKKMNEEEAETDEESAG